MDTLQCSAVTTSTTPKWRATLSNFSQSSLYEELNERATNTYLLLDNLLERCDSRIEYFVSLKDALGRISALAKSRGEDLIVDELKRVISKL